MVRGLVAIASLAAVAAFAPAGRAARAVVTMSARSKSLPFLSQPPKLDGTLAGDEGFDPLGELHAAAAAVERSPD